MSSKLFGSLISKYHKMSLPPRHENKLKYWFFFFSICSFIQQVFSGPCCVSDHGGGALEGREMGNQMTTGHFVSAATGAGQQPGEVGLLYLLDE